jgi:hypothetical protein
MRRSRTGNQNAFSPKLTEEFPMHKFSKTLGAAAIVGAAALAMQPAHAWWGGGPWGGGPGGLGDDFMGDGFGDFNMNMSGRGNGYGRGYNYYQPYYGYPYGGYGYPYGGGYGAPYGYAPYGAPMAPPAPQAPAK